MGKSNPGPFFETAFLLLVCKNSFGRIVSRKTFNKWNADMPKREILERLGRVFMEKFRDPALDTFDDLFAGRLKAPDLDSLQASLSKFDLNQRGIIRDCLVEILDSSLHDLLFAMEENGQFHFEGEELSELSDGLAGELFTDDGWIHRFSKYPENEDS